MFSSSTLSGGDKASISPQRLEAIVRLHENLRKRVSARTVAIAPCVVSQVDSVVDTSDDSSDDN